jgi:hypothetical protein
MCDKEFDRLPDEEKMKYLLTIGASMFGEQTVRMLYDRLAPVIRDCNGHGQDYDDPKDNYWGGVWQVYRAE